MRTGIVGAGHIGGTLAKHFVDAGHEVAVSNSRGPETLAGLVEQLGGGAQALTAAGAARFGDVVVVSVPFGRYRELPTEGVAGNVLIDTNNYYPQRDGHYEGSAATAAPRASCSTRICWALMWSRRSNAILWRRLRDDAGATPAQVALAWLLAQGDNIAPTPGTKRVPRLEENAGADAVELTADPLARLDAIPAAVGDRYADMTRISR